MCVTCYSSTGVTIRQATSSNSNNYWIVKGLATYEIGDSPTEYNFICITNDGQPLTWSRLGGSLGKSQTFSSDAVTLIFANPTDLDAGIYTCSIHNTDTVLASLNITTGNLMSYDTHIYMSFIYS